MALTSRARVCTRPQDLSFFVAGFFGDVKVLQQNLLEENSTVKRLQCEKEILTDTVKCVRAWLHTRMRARAQRTGARAHARARMCGVHARIGGELLEGGLRACSCSLMARVPAAAAAP